MSTEKQVKANQKNAQESTSPKTCATRSLPLAMTWTRPEMASFRRKSLWGFDSLGAYRMAEMSIFPNDLGRIPMGETVL